MFNIRNTYALHKFSQILDSTQSLFLMGCFVIISGCLAWIFMRGIYGHKLVRLRYVLFWMTLTQLIYMSLFVLVRTHIAVYEDIKAVALRIGLWIITGLVVSYMPLIRHALQLSLKGRIGYLVTVHVIMRVLLFTLMGILFIYGLYDPKLLSKIAKVAPACRDTLLCIIKDL